MAEEIIVVPEFPNVRVRSAHLNFLFRDIAPEEVKELYSRFVREAREHFHHRWQAIEGANIDQAAFDCLTRELTLHWMYFYIVNHLPVTITESNWNHPQSLRIIYRNAEAYFGERSSAAEVVSATLVGLSREHYVSWRQGDDEFLSMW